MNPAEAAALLEQLDTPIALELLGRMPGKRIGQILALMTSERALTLTRMLSGR
jgi:flagellar motility protein MotE (MotC chaperone)